MCETHNARENVPSPPCSLLWIARTRSRSALILVLYVLSLALSSIHVYRKPVYATDSIQYMGNALLMEETDVVRIHDRVYAELKRSVPESAHRVLIGEDPAASEDHNRPRRDRARDPYHFAEFLPLFAIRPLYNQTLWLVSQTGLGLVHSGVLISAASYFLMGILLFLWLGRYAGSVFGFAMALLLMMSPPLTELGRETTSDALATLVAFASLYLIFERQLLVPGLSLMLASIFFRTDFVVLAGPTIAACWWERRIDLWKASVLALLAVVSVLGINYFAGDYGIGMLYYRNFVGTPIAPAEMTVQFSFRDYIPALRSGLTLASNSFFLPFLLLGTIGVVSRWARVLLVVTLSYVFLHFLVLPNWQERWVGIYYLSASVCAAATVRKAEESI